MNQWFLALGKPFAEILIGPETFRKGSVTGKLMRSGVNRILSGQDIPLEFWVMIDLRLWGREFLVPGRMCAREESP